MAHILDCDDYTLWAIFWQCTYVDRREDSYYCEYLDPYMMRALRATCRRFAQVIDQMIRARGLPFSRVNIVCYVRHMIGDLHMSDDARLRNGIASRAQHLELVLCEIMCNRAFDASGVSRAELLAYRNDIFRKAMRTRDPTAAQIVARYLWDANTSLSECMVDFSAISAHRMISNAIAQWGEDTFARYYDEYESRINGAKSFRELSQSIEAQGITNSVQNFIDTLSLDLNMRFINCVIIAIAIRYLHKQLITVKLSTRVIVETRIIEYSPDLAIKLPNLIDILADYFDRKTLRSFCALSSNGQLFTRETWTREFLTSMLDDIYLAHVAFNPRDRDKVPFLRERLREEFGVTRALDLAKYLIEHKSALDRFHATFVYTHFGAYDSARYHYAFNHAPYDRIDISWLLDFEYTDDPLVMARIDHHLAQLPVTLTMARFIREVSYILSRYRHMLYARNLIDIIVRRLYCKVVNPQLSGETRDVSRTLVRSRHNISVRWDYWRTPMANYLQSRYGMVVKKMN